MPAPAPFSRASDSALLKHVGLLALTASMVNITVGGSIFVLPAALAKMLGAAAPLAWLLGALLFIPIVGCFASAGSRVTATGGAYSYVEAAFGRFPGFVVAAFFWVSSVTGSGGVASALTDQLAHVAPSLGTPAARTGLLGALYAALVLLNAFGVKAGASAIIAFALAKALPLTLLALLGLTHMRTSNLHIEAMPGWDALGSSLVIVMFAFSGIETAVCPAGEVRNPSRAVPKAAVSGFCAVVVLYVALQLMSQGVLGAGLPRSSAPLASVAQGLFTGGAGILVLTASVSMIGFLQGDLLGASRLLYALAGDGLLPSALTAVTRRTRVPARAVVTHAAIAFALAAAGSFTTLALVSGGAICIVYLGCCAAAWRLQRTGEGEGAAAITLPGGPAIPLAGMLGLVLIMMTLSRAEWIALAVCALAVLLGYAARRSPSRAPSGP